MRHDRTVAHEPLTGAGATAGRGFAVAPVGADTPGRVGGPTRFTPERGVRADPRVEARGAPGRVGADMCPLSSDAAPTTEWRARSHASWGTSIGENDEAAAPPEGCGGFGEASSAYLP